MREEGEGRRVWYFPKAYPNTNRIVILRIVVLVKSHLSSSSTITKALPLLESIGGVGNGVGGTLSKAEENIPNNEDEECAIFKLARDKKDESRLPFNPDKFKPEELFR